MIDKTQERRRRRPQVDEAREFLEITQDFTDPREAIREAISNSVDWDATEIRITVTEDSTRPDEELIIRVRDNGMGLTEQRLHAFFDLGNSTPLVETDSQAHTAAKRIGYKGHGTKTYYNSREIEVESYTFGCACYAVMSTPLQKLMNNEVPEYEYILEEKTERETFTQITIHGYNMNRDKRDFAHDVLKDYILWFTRFGSVESEFDILGNQNKEIYLQGLGQPEPDLIEFGHPFPPENCDIDSLMQRYPGDWTNTFVKRWYFQREPVVDYPGKFIDMVFYIEGDKAKRSYNPMIRGRGRTPQYGMYKVEDRYGLWVCKDYIPIRRHNEWLGLGKRLETKYHAFVNCQDFRLTANRGDVGNTPPDLLSAIERTVRQIFEDRIIGSSDYQEYEEYAELERQYQTAAQEGADFTRRRKRVVGKKVCDHKGIQLIEPSMEMGVVSLFNLVYALEQSAFPFRVVDYDTKRGYDALVVHGTPLDLSQESVSFAEFKYMLNRDFNHSFDHLMAVICWDCNLPDGAEVRDIRDKRRTLRITPISDESNYTRYMLVTHKEYHNIEVFVLKDYLREKFGIEFRPRVGTS
jgi:hypothetical protein